MLKARGRSVPVIDKNVGNLFPRFKVPALSRPAGPHKRVRRTKAQIAADEAAKPARRVERARAA
jgi:hypothetical protein